MCSMDSCLFWYCIFNLTFEGRTRKPGGRFDLVVHDYRGLDGKDKLSKEQEQIMQQATDAVSSLSIKQMKRGVSRSNSNVDCENPDHISH